MRTNPADPIIARKRRTRTQLFIWPPILLLILVQSSFGLQTMPLALVEALVVLIGGSVTLTRLLKTGFWSPGNLFFIVLAVFHLGLVPFWRFGWDPHFPRASDYTWFLGDVGLQALIIVLIALVAYIIGVVVYEFLRNVTVESRPIDKFAYVPGDRVQRFSVVGSVLLLFGLLAWFVTGVSSGGGLAIFFGSYSSWLAQTSGNSSLSIIYPLIGIGLGLAVMAPPVFINRVALAGYLMFATVAFLLGLRGEVLFPFAVACSVLAFRRKMPGTLRSAFGFLSVLLLISAARIIRQVGVAGTNFAWVDASPLAALGEMGSTIRVVATTVIWHKVNGEPYMNGSTYTVSLARLYESFIDPANRPPGSSDFRIMNTEVAVRAGNIGGSAIAEAFHNFGIPGTLVVFLLFGILFGHFSNMDLNGTRVAIYVCAAVPLFNHVRNSFVPVIPTFLIGVAFLAVIRVAGDTSVKRQRHGIKQRPHP